jgi:hypothetical protein
VAWITDTPSSPTLCHGRPRSLLQSTEFLVIRKTKFLSYFVQQCYLLALIIISVQFMCCFLPREVCCMLHTTTSRCISLWISILQLGSTTVSQRIGFCSLIVIGGSSCMILKNVGGKQN